jgi:acetoin utilization protein AcuB
MPTEQLELLDLIDDISAQKNIAFNPIRFARDIMTKRVRTLTLDHSVNACIKLMKALRIRHIPLMDVPYDQKTKPYFVGIVSQRDILRLISPSVKTPGEEVIDKHALRQLLAQVVARKPITVSPDTPIPEVIITMLDNHIDMVPVLAETEVVGIITAMDIIKIFFRFDKTLRKLYPKLNKTTQPGDCAATVPDDAKPLCLWMSKPVRQIMTIQVISLSPQHDLAEAINLMQDNKFRHIPIIDENGKLQGIISDRDILRHLHYAGKRPMGRQKKFRDHLFRVNQKFLNIEMPLDRIMTQKVTHISPASSTYSAAETLRKTKVSCLPVADDQNNLLGIVTMTDLMAALLNVYK